ADVAELARMADLARSVLGARHEETRIEAARPARRRDGAGNEVETVERGGKALVEKALPVHAKILLGRAAFQGLCQPQAGLFQGLAYRGDGQRARPLRCRGLAQPRPPETTA